MKSPETIEEWAEWYRQAVATGKPRMLDGIKLRPREEPLNGGEDIDVVVMSDDFSDM